MPFGDGTGPMGLGPMTGRAAGFCAGFGMPGYANPLVGYPYGYPRLAPVWPRWGWGFGRGWGRGFGRGWWRWRWYPWW